MYEVVASLWGGGAPWVLLPQGLGGLLRFLYVQIYLLQHSLQCSVIGGKKPVGDDKREV